MNIQVKEEVPKLRYTKVHKGSSKKKCKYHLLMDFFTTYSVSILVTLFLH